MPRIPVINTSHHDRIDELLVDNIDTGEFKLHRSVFTDEALFDLERLCCINIQKLSSPQSIQI